MVDVLAPDGIVLGLGIEGVAARFEQLLEECTIALRDGDVFVLFTDGITEAMNPTADLFGEERLQDLVAEHGHLLVRRDSGTASCGRSRRSPGGRTSTTT